VGEAGRQDAVTRNTWTLPAASWLKESKMQRNRFRKSALATGALLFGAMAAYVPAFAAGTSSTSASASAAASPANTNATAAKSAVAGADRQFAMKAAQGGMGEVELGKLAQSKAQNEQVKAFGERMANDHSKAGDKLKQVASSDGMQLPDKMDAASERLLNKLKKMSGPQFDQAYMSEMVSDHQKDIREFEKEAKSGRNSDLKQFASETLPTLREHLALAQSAKQAAMSEKRGTASGKSMSSQAMNEQSQSSANTRQGSASTTKQ
jgi:putative membrane protein